MSKEKRYLKKIGKLLDNFEQLREELDEWKPEHKHVKARLRYAKTGLSYAISSISFTKVCVEKGLLLPEDSNVKDLKRVLRFWKDNIEKLKGTNGEIYASAVTKARWEKKLKNSQKKG